MTQPKKVGVELIEFASLSQPAYNPWEGIWASEQGARVTP